MKHNNNSFSNILLVAFRHSESKLVVCSTLGKFICSRDGSHVEMGWKGLL